MYTLYAKVHFKIEWRFERSTIYTLFSNKQIFGYDNGTITSRVIHFLNFLGKNLPIGAPIEIYRRRRRVEFIGGGGVPAAAPTSAVSIFILTI